MSNRLDFAAERARRERGLPAGTAPLVDPIDPHPLIAAAAFRLRDPDDAGTAAALAQAGIGTWSLDRATGTLCVDAVGVSLLRVADAAGIPEAAVHREDTAAARSAVRAVLDGQHPEATADFRVADPDGRWSWLRIRAVAVSDGVSGTLQDITADRKRAEDAEAERAFLDGVYHGVQQAMFVIDVCPDGAFRLRSVNDFHTELTGLTTEMVAGRTPHEIEALPPETADHVTTQYRTCVENDAVYEYEECIVIDGVESWWVTRLTPVRDEHGAIIRLIGSASNESERRNAAARRVELERNLQASQRLESLGVLAGGVAHEFNNILTTILGTTDLLREELEDAEGAATDLATIEQAARDAADLCRQLLAYSGQGRFRTQATSLAGFVAERQALLRLSAGPTAQLHLDLRASSSKVEADPSQLAQVLLNLVVNAAEAVEGVERPSITVSTAIVRPTAAERAAWGLPDTVPDGTWALLSVRDDGSGMDPDTRARVFEPFYTTRFTGRGLGLSAVQGIVRGHRGHVGVESTPGHGTTVRVLLPLVDTPAPGPVEDDHAQPTLRVLLVDDEDLVRRTAARMFRKCGAEVVEAADAEAALRCWESDGPFAMLVTDLVMPGPDGGTLATTLRERAPDLCVVLCSGYDAPRLTRRVQDVRADGWLSKPFRLSDARELVARLFPHGA